MKVVGIKHKPEHQKIYYFIVPPHLESSIYYGVEVICNTRRGMTRGVVVDIIEGSHTAMASRLRWMGLRLPHMRHIVSLSEDNPTREFSAADDESVMKFLFG